MNLTVEHATNITLSIGETGTEHEEPIPFTLAGPSHAREVLTEILDNGSPSGWLSPLQPITLSSDERTLAGIPVDATHFAFAYPLEWGEHGFKKLLTLKKTLNVMGTRNEWIYFCAFGGFCYFNCDAVSPRTSFGGSQGNCGELLQVNAITFDSKPQRAHSTSQLQSTLQLQGPFEANPKAIEALRSLTRIKSITIQVIRDWTGFSEFAWVNPSETFATRGPSIGDSFSESSEYSRPNVQLGVEPYEHGAFLYTGSEEKAPVYYRIVEESTNRHTPRRKSASPNGHRKSVRRKSLAEAAGAVQAVMLKKSSSSSGLFKGIEEIKHELTMVDKMLSNPRASTLSSVKRKQTEKKLFPEEPGSLLNRETKSSWFFSKTTRLYVLDVMARSMGGGALDRNSGWVPSEWWRVYWKVLLLALSTVDIILCANHLAFCRGPLGFASDWAIQTCFAIDMLLQFKTAYIMPGGLLELNPRRIVMHYLRTTFLIDLVALVPLERVLERGSNRLIDERYYMLSWQWLRLPRWLLRWQSFDDFMSITNTAIDNPIAVCKYVILLGVFISVGTALNYIASDGLAVCGNETAASLQMEELNSRR